MHIKHKKTNYLILFLLIFLLASCSGGESSETANSDSEESVLNSETSLDEKDNEPEKEVLTVTDAFSPDRDGVWFSIFHSKLKDDTPEELGRVVKNSEVDDIFVVSEGKVYYFHTNILKSVYAASSNDIGYFDRKYDPAQPDNDPNNPNPMFQVSTIGGLSRLLEGVKKEDMPETIVNYIYENMPEDAFFEDEFKMTGTRFFYIAYENDTGTGTGYVSVNFLYPYYNVPRFSDRSGWEDPSDRTRDEFQARITASEPLIGMDRKFEEPIAIYDMKYDGYYSDHAGDLWLTPYDENVSYTINEMDDPVLDGVNMGYREKHRFIDEQEGRD